MGAEYVFGYGSLAARPDHRPSRGFDPAGYVTDLDGYVRDWGVAMDNTRDLPGYKYYVAADGGRPAVSVAFLDVRPCAGGRVNGICAPVHLSALAELDARERNYTRTDVTERIAGARGRVWTYIGTPEGRARLATARERRTAVIDAGYLRLVTDAFRRLGADEYERCRAGVDPKELPVLMLRRVELPG